MIKSMTGFGQARGGKTPLRWNVEIRSWNHRFFEYTGRLPNILIGFDDRIRDLLKNDIKRGKVAVSITLKSNSDRTENIILDEKKISFYIRSIRALKKKYGLKDDLTVNALVSIPDIFTVERREDEAESLWLSLKPVIQSAARRLVTSKEREGKTLAQDLTQRLKEIKKSISEIEALSESQPKQRFEKLKARILELMEDSTLELKNIDREVAFIADRGDITEELVRAKHHVEVFLKSLHTSEEVGKKLDFIAQELQREVNTIASKSQSALVSEGVVRIKSEIEKIREQVQNIE